MKELLERCIGRVYVSRGEEYIKFENLFNRSVAIYRAGSECCSETWFADIIGVDSLLGEEVIGVEKMEIWWPQDGRTRQDSDTAYGYKLKTDKGITDIIFRNSSNGYYGGGIYLYDLPKHGDPKVEWVEITKDWSAPGSGGE